ncbi:hypothetical protein [Nonomuraea rhodomycinica]|uniref:Uncharacterized protein n=1 Tax=Nonomuraea rhodomycinica TaxID=1712872 RepID=A0A7Y6ISK6_9ACTN|nr:hypothetical protein [Nonomuraea rhodomycinica]NUW43642.1 hypothetical protein [Nonomuraea rhodomycinica]
MSGYSYTTINVTSDGEPRIRVSLYPDERARVEYYPAERGCPFLNIEHAGARVSIGLTHGSEVAEQHVRFARGLLDAAAAFLADCERLHAEQPAAA